MVPKYTVNCKYLSFPNKFLKGLNYLKHISNKFKTLKKAGFLKSSPQLLTGTTLRL